ncbi:SCO2525 family SAM-dependent methyltransferase [Streptomyces sp. SID12501]|uniref:Methyltransferase n=1 Tax=Streptomyces sp. SID12501 TaxID=2706042 RepID=A0A6B3BVC0_9ACTN|nr:SCO2525 family SAM-dependent methyltransferase [Streptomyces sp. SID12501]NEC88305.1 methyltransferase [Streptomyces sp. SID12501]
MAGNSAYGWDAFDSEAYLNRNYARLHNEDHKILKIVRDFLCAQSFDVGARGVDVRSGSNLYPALAMLPFCSEISLLEFSEANRKWLSGRLAKGYLGNWDIFWRVLAENEVYRAVQGPGEQLRTRATVREWDILRSTPDERWDLGTMFFVADSITTDRAEFTTALRQFIALLKPGAPFVMTFMENFSTGNFNGYKVGTRTFPALDIVESDVEDCLSDLINGREFHHIDPAADDPIRDGYVGMILVHGHTK